MAGKRQNMAKLNANKQHRSNVNKAIKNGMLMGNARLQFLQQPKIKKEMQDWYSKQQTKLIKQKI